MHTFKLRCAGGGGGGGVRAGGKVENSHSFLKASLPKNKSFNMSYTDCIFERQYSGYVGLSERDHYI